MNLSSASFLSFFQKQRMNVMAPPGSRNSVESRLIEEGVLQGQKNITVLDGGFATQLGCHVEEPIDGDVLWSARFLATNPQAVIDTHLDFLRGKGKL